MSVKISELPVLAPEDVAAGDVVAIVDESEGVTKQVDLAGVVIDLAPDPVPDPQDDTDTNAYLWSVGDVQDAVIVESDSNANGRFVKYSDGTMICYLVRLETRTSSGVHTTSVAFPAAFVSSPIPPLNDESVNVQVSLRTGVPATAVNITTDAITLTGCNVLVDRSTATTSIFHLTATGRWK